VKNTNLLLTFLFRTILYTFHFSLFVFHSCEASLTGGDQMIKQIAWNTFKNTGNIDTFLELKQVTDIEEEIKEGTYGDDQNKWSNNGRKAGGRF